MIPTKLTGRLLKGKQLQRPVFCRKCGRRIKDAVKNVQSVELCKSCQRK
jgi:hypothetical protein